MSDREASAGVNRFTGAPLYGWGHVVQSLGVIWSTFLGERVMREDFGNPGLRLLGENMTEANILRFWNCLKIVTDFREPRFSIVQITLRKTTPEEMRKGALGFDVRGIYRPRGHLGDKTPFGERRVAVDLNDQISVESL
ncbi:MAG: hypothetical protein FD152_1369 [Xanthobacteraceae bacterium]|nr:MAG: hypothetical protein FD152_1369 [Xanthobacteraceae bacterium]